MGDLWKPCSLFMVPVVRSAVFWVDVREWIISTLFLLFIQLLQTELLVELFITIRVTAHLQKQRQDGDISLKCTIWDRAILMDSYEDCLNLKKLTKCTIFHHVFPSKEMHFVALDSPGHPKVFNLL